MLSINNFLTTKFNAFNSHDIVNTVDALAGNDFSSSSSFFFPRFRLRFSTKQQFLDAAFVVVDIASVQQHSDGREAKDSRGHGADSTSVKIKSSGGGAPY